MIKENYFQGLASFLDRENHLSMEFCSWVQGSMDTTWKSEFLFNFVAGVHQWGGTEVQKCIKSPTFHLQLYEQSPWNVSPTLPRHAHHLLFVLFFFFIHCFSFEDSFFFFSQILVFQGYLLLNLLTLPPLTCISALSLCGIFVFDQFTRDMVY